MPKETVPKETDIERLEARVVELENALKAITAFKQPVDVSAAEIKAYLKIIDIFACIPSKACIPLRCIYECVCGPCNIGDFGRGGLTRFTDLGS